MNPSTVILFYYYYFFFLSFFFLLIDPSKVSKLPESRKVLLVKSGILDRSILNSAQVIRNPGFSEMESIIQDYLVLLHTG